MLNKRFSQSTWLLILLIIGDLAFATLHIIFEIPQYSDFPPIIDYVYYETFLLTVDGSFPEWYQYLKFIALIILLNHILRITQEKNFLAWGCVFAYLLLDDALRIHEDLGGYVASFFEFTAPMGLRLKDIGEFAVLGGIGLLLLAALTVGYLRGSKPFKKTTIDIILLFSALAFFAIVVDLLHPLLDIPLYRVTMATLEDAGEMFAVSLILWYVFRMTKEGAYPEAFLHERVWGVNRLVTWIRAIDWQVDLVRPFVGFGRKTIHLLRTNTTPLVTLLYTAYIAFITWPALGKLGTDIPGNNEDAYVHLWGFEWVRDSLLNGQSPWFTTKLFFPHGTDLYSHNIAWLNIAAWLPLQLLIGSATAYTVLFLAAFVLNALSGFWLTRELTDNSWAAFIGGLIVGGWQYTLLQFTKPNLILIGFIPLAMWSILRLAQTAHESSRRYMWLTTIFLAAIGITRFQLFGISLVLLIPWAILCIWSYRDNQLPTLLKRLSVAGAIAGLIITPFVAPLLYNQLTRDFPTDLYDTDTYQVIDLLSYLLPFNGHRFLAKITQPYTPPIQERFFIGLVPLLLFTAGYLRESKRRWYWLISAGVLLILALGDRLVINETAYFSLPYQLTRGTNLDGLIGNPNRFNVLLSIPFAVLAAYGAVAVFQWAEPVYRPLVLIVLTLFISAEYQLRYKMVTLETPAWYSDLAQEEGDFGILPIPHSRDFSERYMNYQRTHGKGIVEGHVSRVPREAYAFIDSVPLLTYLNDNAVTANENAPPFDLNNVTQQFERLADANIRYFVIHKNFMDIKVVDRWRNWLAVTPIFEDEVVLVYDTRLEDHVDQLQPITANIALIQSLNNTPEKRSNQTLQLTTHWLVTPNETLPNEICLSLTDADVECQPLILLLTDASQQIIRTTQRLRVDKEVRPNTYPIFAQLRANGEPLGEPIELLTANIIGPERLFVRPEIDVEVDAAFEDRVRLLGYDEAVVSAESRLTQTLYWQAIVEKSRSVKYFLHVTDADGNVVAQADAMHRNWAYPNYEWASAEIVPDTVEIDMSDVPAGDYQLSIGLTDLDTSERLPIKDSNGSPIINNIFLLGRVEKK